MCLPSNMSHKADCVNKSFPSLFCLVSLPTGTVEYSSDKISSVNGFFELLPEELREFFCVVEYRAIINKKEGEI